MAWTIDYSDSAERELSRLDRQAANRIRSYMLERVVILDDSRDRGKRLRWNLKDYWRYRVGDYRIICDIQYQALVVLVVEVAHRGQAYR